MANVAQYGWVNLRDVSDRLVTDVGVTVVNTEIDRTIAQHNAEMDATMGLFVRRTTDFKRIYRTPATSRSQALDEVGRALPIKGGSSYELEWPVQRSGNAWGFDYETGLKMTVNHAAEQNELMINGDRVWMREHVLAALFQNITWTWKDDVEDIGTLTIHGLANNDTVTYMRVGGRAAAIAQHYLAQAADIGDADNPFPTIAATLKRYPDNSGKVIVLVATNLRADIEDLATFRMTPDPNIRPAASDELLIGSLGVTVPGEVVGYVDGCWVVEWPSLPDDYMIGLMSGGERPVAMREDVIASLQGFNRVATREDFPYTEFQYRRKAGFGAWNRVGALVYQIGSASYSIPTGYANPMP